MLYAWKAHFKRGSIVEPMKGDRHVAEWSVRKFDHLLEHIILFFEKHNLKVEKSIEFQRFRHICMLMKEKVHRTPEGLEKCILLAREWRVKAKIQWK